MFRNLLRTILPNLDLTPSQHQVLATEVQKARSVHLTLLALKVLQTYPRLAH